MQHKNLNSCKPYEDRRLQERQEKEVPAEHWTNYTTQLALDLKNVERKSFKSGLTLVGR